MMSLTSNWIPVNDDAVHTASNDDLEQRIVDDLGDSSRVREAVGVEWVQLLVQHHGGYLHAREDELARGRVVHGRDRRPLAHYRWDVDVGLPD